jgi:amidase
MREWTIAGLQEAYRSGETTPNAVIAGYLARIDEIDTGDGSLNSVIELNSEARSLAESATSTLRDGSPSGLLFGVPVLLKDNIDTSDGMKTTAGSLALLDTPPPEDAFLVRRLREEGAIILGKTNLSEWANFRSTRSNSGWSSRGGQTRNPYALNRTPCGSSSGSGAAIAANLAVVAVGTETDGSVTCPSAHNSLAGLKPTIGTISRSGIIPISASQDTAGPMARTVRDAAILLQAMAGRDDRDEASFESADFLRELTPDALQGRRIGIIREYATNPGMKEPLENVIAALRECGAEIIDGVEMPDIQAAGEHELTVLRYEFKHGLAEYFARRGGAIRSIDDIIAFNSDHSDEVMPLFGQEQMIAAAECGPLTDEAYRTALQESRRIAGTEGVLRVLAENRLDALCAPTNGPSWIIDHVNGDYYTGGRMSSGPAISGCPHLTLPAGYHRGLPIGISLIAMHQHDAELLGMGYALEQALRARRPPRFTPAV